MKEIWKDIKGLEGRYQVSNLGRIRSIPHYCKNRFGARFVEGKIRAVVGKITNEKAGRRRDVRSPSFTVGRKPCKCYRVHTVVLETFVGPCPEGMECCHGDGDPTNNRLDNLRWDTPKNNMKDRERHGRHDKGSRSVKAKLTESDIPVIRKLLTERTWWGGMSSIAREYGVDTATIRDIRDGSTWRHVS